MLEEGTYSDGLSNIVMEVVKKTQDIVYRKSSWTEKKRSKEP